MSDFDPSLRAARASLLPGFEGPVLPEWLERRLRDGLGGVCLFGSNVVSPAQVRRLTDAIYAANPDAIIAIDEEGGDVTRLYYDSGAPYPGNAILGRLDDLALTEAVGRQVGGALRAAGCNLDFAPDADVNSNPDNPVIGVRSFGADPGLVSRHTASWVRGLQSAGVAACAKHFPGHGDTSTDSHLALAVADGELEELRARELAPFRAAIAAGTRAIMSSHLLLPRIDPDNAATFSSRVLNGLLRDELGFEGVIVTDALDMAGASGRTGIPEAAVRALAAGCDLLCIGSRNTDEQIARIEEAILSAVREERLPRARLTEAASRVVSLARETSAAARARDEIALLDEAAGEHSVDPERVIEAFAVRPSVLDTLASAPSVRLIRIETTANIAVGEAPWGLWAALDASGGEGWAERLRRLPQSVATAAEPEPAGRAKPAGPPETGRPLPYSCTDIGGQADAASGIGSIAIVVGRDNHLHPHARALIDDLRQAGRVVAIEMGWPSADGRYADVATFGASRLAGEALGRALARWLP